MRLILPATRPLGYAWRMHDSPTPGHASSLRIILPDAVATEGLGARLGLILRAGDVVALRGDLGMGKSTLARAAVRAALAEPDLAVPSPTFTLVQSYDGPDCAIWHVDLYRLDGPEDALELGLDEAFADAASLIEWPDRLGRSLPADRLDVTLREDGEGRMADIQAGPSWTARIEELRP